MFCLKKAPHGFLASLVAWTVKRLPTMRETGFDPWVGKVPWRRKWQPTPVFMPGKSHGPRSLVGYSPWDHKESDMTERLHFIHSSRPLFPFEIPSSFWMFLVVTALDFGISFSDSTLHLMVFRH